jgi:hypothetical protein
VATFLHVQDHTNVRRWAETIAVRPTVQLGRMANRVRARGYGMHDALIALGCHAKAVPGDGSEVRLVHVK